MGDTGSVPGLERSPGEGKGYPLWYSGPENPMDCIVHRVAKSQTQLNEFHFHFIFTEKKKKRNKNMGSPGGAVVKNLPAM